VLLEAVCRPALWRAPGYTGDGRRCEEIWTRRRRFEGLDARGVEG
jgi:hypothetical protein